MPEKVILYLFSLASNFNELIDGSKVSIYFQFRGGINKN